MSNFIKHWQQTGEKGCLETCDRGLKEGVGSRASPGPFCHAVPTPVLLSLCGEQMMVAVHSQPFPLSPLLFMGTSRHPWRPQNTEDAHDTCDCLQIELLSAKITAARSRALSP